MGDEDLENITSRCSELDINKAVETPTPISMEDTGDGEVGDINTMFLADDHHHPNHQIGVNPRCTIRGEASKQRNQFLPTNCSSSVAQINGTGGVHSGWTDQSGSTKSIVEMLSSDSSTKSSGGGGEFLEDMEDLVVPSTRRWNPAYVGWPKPKYKQNLLKYKKGITGPRPQPLITREINNINERPTYMEASILNIRSDNHQYCHGHGHGAPTSISDPHRHHLQPTFSSSPVTVVFNYGNAINRKDTTFRKQQRVNYREKYLRNIRWTEDEHRLFLAGLKRFGRGMWEEISWHFVPTKSASQIASHAHKYFLHRATG